jgi:chemotaxis protein CheD
MPDVSTIVPVGEFRVSQDPLESLVTVTGSCLAVALYDSGKKLAGMAHLVLPEDHRAATEGPGAPEAWYVKRGIKGVLRQMTQMGAEPGRITAQLAGGGTLVSGKAFDSIGEQNLAAAEVFLGELGIPITGRWVGGRGGRKVTFEVATGNLEVQGTLRQRDPGNPRGPAHTPAGSPDAKLVASRISHLKPNPRLAGKLLDAMHQPTIDWPRAFGLAVRDLVLAYQIMRLCNSAYYGSPGRIDSLSGALALLGPKRLRQIMVLSASMRHSDNPIEYPGGIMAELSRHSLATAIIAGELAKQAKGKDPQMVFMAGLFHALGALAILFSDKAHPPGGLLEQCTALSQCGGLSGALLESFSLPADICAMAAHHERPSAGPEDLMPYAAAVHAGCTLSRQLGLYTKMEPAESRADMEAMRAAGLAGGITQLPIGVIQSLDKWNMLENSGAKSDTL